MELFISNLLIIKLYINKFIYCELKYNENIKLSINYYTKIYL